MYQGAAFVTKAVHAEKERAILKGTGSLKKLPIYLKKKNINSVLIVTDSSVYGSGMLNPMMEKMVEEGIKIRVFSGAGSNPTALMTERCARAYSDGGCNAIVAVGSGAVIDCAKLAGIKAANEKADISALDGARPFMGKIPPLFAAPTTAGTGSEVSTSAICFDKKKKVGRTVTAKALRPSAAILDPSLTENLPKNVIACTAMSALCRAVETYISKNSTNTARNNALMSVRLVFANLPKAYGCSDNDARIELQKAAYLAGGGSGYAHYCSVAAGAMYRVSYAEAAAVLLPAVLRAYGEKAHKRLAALGQSVGISGESDAEIAEGFIAAIEKMNESFGIPSKLSELKKSGIPKIAKEASSRCNPFYAAPKQLFYDDICNMLQKVK